MLEVQRETNNPKAQQQLENPAAMDGGAGHGWPAMGQGQDARAERTRPQFPKSPEAPTQPNALVADRAANQAFNFHANEAKPNQPQPGVSRAETRQPSQTRAKQGWRVANLAT